jgi:hypothetical protein
MRAQIAPDFISLFVHRNQLDSAKWMLSAEQAASDGGKSISFSRSALVSGIVRRLRN